MKSAMKMMPIESSFWRIRSRPTFPAASDVELSNRPDWNSASPTLVAEYDLKVPGWAAVAGQRAVMPVGLFGAQEKRTFQHHDASASALLRFPHQSADDVAIELPPNWQVSSSPKPRKRQSHQAMYSARPKSRTDHCS